MNSLSFIQCLDNISPPPHSFSPVSEAERHAYLILQRCIHFVIFVPFELTLSDFL